MMTDYMMPTAVYGQAMHYIIIAVAALAIRSAYNYRGNLLAARIAELIGEDFKTISRS